MDFKVQSYSKWKVLGNLYNWESNQSLADISKTIKFFVTLSLKRG